MKKCKDCGETKPFTEYAKNYRMKDGYINKCHDCLLIEKAIYRDKNKLKLREYQRNYQATPEYKVKKQVYRQRPEVKLKERQRKGYNIIPRKSKGHKNNRLSKDEYNIMLEKQGHNCAICHNHLIRPNIDHDHKTNKIRGLLCFHCNVGLGFFKDKVEYLNDAIKYLSKS